MEVSLLHVSTVEQAHDLLNRLGCYAAGTDLMAVKAMLVVIRVNGLLPQAANILKQEMLAKGGEVAVPAGALRLDAQRVDCIVMGTPSQYSRLADILEQQPFGLAELAGQLRLFAALATTRPHWDWPVTGSDMTVGGLVDCDLRPSGVVDHTANCVALAWNLLEQRSDFLVVVGSDGLMVRNVADQLVATAACPVVAWVPDGQAMGLVPSMPVIVQQGSDIPSTDGPVLAMCTGEGSGEFIQMVAKAGVGVERLFITVALERPQADLPSIRPALIGLPRLDVVILRQQAIASLPVNTQASVLTRLVDRGTSIFITDTPRHIAELLDDAGHDPWNSSPTQK